MSAEGWRETPPNILQAVKQAEAGVAELQSIAKNIKLDRKFTLDGRLVGDIGELLLCGDFEILPDKKPDGHAHDLVGSSITGQPIHIQVKLRRATKGVRIEFKYQPEYLVVIECSEDWSRWRMLYNGSGEIVTADDIEVRLDDRRILRDGENSFIYLSKAELLVAAQRKCKATIQLADKTRRVP